jgi:hypothetical protein
MQGGVFAFLFQSLFFITRNYIIFHYTYQGRFLTIQGGLKMLSFNLLILSIVKLNVVSALLSSEKEYAIL